MDEPTGVVDQVRTELARLPEAAIHEHVAVLDGVHKLLQDALAELDEA